MACKAPLPLRWKEPGSPLSCFSLTLIVIGQGAFTPPCIGHKNLTHGHGGKQPMNTANRRQIGVLIFDGIKMLDFVGPSEVFAEANQYNGNYDLHFVSADGKDVTTSIGIKVSASVTVADAPHFDILIVPGSELAPSVFTTPEVLSTTLELAAKADRVAAVCSGAFVLAAAGLLDNKRATTHWKFVGDLAKFYPSVTVEPDAIFVKDGLTYTSAGVAAGMDLALALVEEDCGADVARSVAQGLLVYMRRGAGQSQFSASLQGPAPKTPLVRTVVDRINEDPSAQHSVAQLAAFANVSVRHLSRLFREELDSTPLEYAAAMRFDRAKALLDKGFPIVTVAAEAGFTTPEALRRAFNARLGISPLKYQQRFRSTRVGEHASDS